MSKTSLQRDPRGPAVGSGISKAGISVAGISVIEQGFPLFIGDVLRVLAELFSASAMYRCPHLFEDFSRIEFLARGGIGGSRRIVGCRTRHSRRQYIIPPYMPSGNIKQRQGKSRLSRESRDQESK